MNIRIPLKKKNPAKKIFLFFFFLFSPALHTRLQRTALPGGKEDLLVLTTKQLALRLAALFRSSFIAKVSDGDLDGGGAGAWEGGSLIYLSIDGCEDR